MPRAIRFCRTHWWRRTAKHCRVWCKLCRDQAEMRQRMRRRQYKEPEAAALQKAAEFQARLAMIVKQFRSTKPEQAAH